MVCARRRSFFAAIFGAAAITAAVYQRQRTMPKTSLKPTRQLDLFAAFQSPSAAKQKQVVEHTGIKLALLWFRGWPKAQQEWPPKNRMNFYNKAQADLSPQVLKIFSIGSNLVMTFCSQVCHIAQQHPVSVCSTFAAIWLCLRSSPLMWLQQCCILHPVH